MALTQEKFNITKLGAQGDELTGFVDVNFLLWHSKGAVAGDDLIVKDSAGNILWVDTADAANYKNFCPIKNRVNGVDADTMDSGELFIYKEAEFPMQV